MDETRISKTDLLAKVIHANPSVLMVIERMGIRLGIGNSTVKSVAVTHHINEDVLVMILNIICYENYYPKVAGEIDFIPDLLVFLKKSHGYFLEKKIPEIQRNIKKLVGQIEDPKSVLVEDFYTNYIKEVTEHILYENDTVFPYIEKLLLAYSNKTNIPKDYNITVYGNHHDDIETVLTDLKNILIRHLPHKENGSLRLTILQQLFELESDLYSHTKIENDVLIPLVEKLEKDVNSH